MDRTFDRMPGHSFAPGRNPAEARRVDFEDLLRDLLLPGDDPLLLVALILCAACVMAIVIGRHIHHVRTKLRMQRLHMAMRAAEAANAQCNAATTEPPIVHRSARMARMMRRS